MQTLPKRKPGKPVTHPPVRNCETGETFETYTEAGEAVNGDRHGVRRCAEGTQRHHHDYHFEFVQEGDDGTSGT